MLTGKNAILNKARLIPLVIALFQIFYRFTGIAGALEAVGQSFFLDAIFYSALPAVLRLSQITV